MSVVVEVIGGLGNQMFQYAFGRGMARRSNQKLKLDITPFETYKLHNYLLNSLSVSESFSEAQEIAKLKSPKRRWSQFLRVTEPASPRTYVKETKFFQFDSEIGRMKGSRFYSGYWQNPRYFADVEEIIRQEFQSKDLPNERNSRFLDEIGRAVAVSLHVRRGDYVTNPVTNSVHGTCDAEYYRKAVAHIQSRVENVHLFVFSDDLPWAKTNLSFSCPITVVDANDRDTGAQDLRLMSRCQHHIIANSTFSWWGAWLNPRSDKIVIAPQKWFQTDQYDTSDLCPTGWIILG